MNISKKGLKSKFTRIWAIPLKSPEGSVLKIGAVMSLIYVILLVLGLRWSPEIFKTLIAMSTTNIFFGRATAISFGYTMGLGQGTVIPAIMLNETLLVLVFYPLYVFSINSLLVIPALSSIVGRIKKTVESNYPVIRKYGIIGLFLFVWFPFWMTGPVVGCVIGFFLGFKPLINVIVVLSGTYVAILCWSIFLKKLYDKVATSNPLFPMILLAIVIFIIIITRFLRAGHSENGSRKKNK